MSQVYYQSIPFLGVLQLRECSTSFSRTVGVMPLYPHCCLLPDEDQLESIRVNESQYQADLR
jgi:hypothetical protein